MRYQIELGPRMPSTRTSAGCNRSAAAGWRARQVSNAAIASSFVLVRAISISGITDRRRPVPSPRCAPLGAFSAGPSSSARVSSRSRPPAVSSMPAHGSPMSANRCGTVATVNAAGSQPATSSHPSGVETRASGVARTEYAERDGAVFGVLVEVDEHPFAFLFPPAAGGQLRCAPLHFPRHRLGRQPHLSKRPARLDPRIDVESARPGRLGPRGQPVVLEHLAGDLCDVEDLSPCHAGHRVQIDP